MGHTDVVKALLQAGADINPNPTTKVVAFFGNGKRMDTPTGIHNDIVTLFRSYRAITTTKVSVM